MRDRPVELIGPDQRMPDLTGIELLDRSRAHAPVGSLPMCEAGIQQVHHGGSAEDVAAVVEHQARTGDRLPGRGERSDPLLRTIGEPVNPASTASSTVSRRGKRARMSPRPVAWSATDERTPVTSQFGQPSMQRSPTSGEVIPAR